MYITIGDIKKKFGKWIEMSDVIIALPSFILFLILFMINQTRIISLIFGSIIVFLLLPVNLSKKNRMYKIILLTIKYLFNKKEYIYRKEYYERRKDSK